MELSLEGLEIGVSEEELDEGASLVSLVLIELELIDEEEGSSFEEKEELWLELPDGVVTQEESRAREAAKDKNKDLLFMAYRINEKGAN